MYNTEINLNYDPYEVSANAVKFFTKQINDKMFISDFMGVDVTFANKTPMTIDMNDLYSFELTPSCIGCGKTNCKGCIYKEAYEKKN